MPLTEEKIALLKEKAWLARRNTIQTLMWAGGGHAGGGLSQIDILITLYYHYLNIDPKKPDWEDRDRVVLSKGHGGISYAPILAELGYFKHELLKEFNHTGSPFGMHLDMLQVPGVDASTGSLGHGPVSYTHLDVYKRQALDATAPGEKLIILANYTAMMQLRPLLDRRLKRGGP